MSNEFRARELVMDNDVLEALLRGVRTYVELGLPPDVQILRIYQKPSDEWSRQFRLLMVSDEWPEARPNAIEQVAVVAH